MGACQDINKPTVDETPMQCEELISSDCVVTTEANGFLGVIIGNTLTAIITKISQKIQVVNTKYNNTINLTALQVFADDTAAGVGGIIVGKAYIRTTGELAIRLT